METAHVFVSTKRFKSFKDMREFIDPTYNDDGDCVDSAFMKETKLSFYEPMCIEAIHEENIMPIKKLLEGVSFSEQWIDKLDSSIMANEAICVLEPNKLATPKETSLIYCGAFQYST